MQRRRALKSLGAVVLVLGPAVGAVVQSTAACQGGSDGGPELIIRYDMTNQ